MGRKSSRAVFKLSTLTGSVISLRLGLVSNCISTFQYKYVPVEVRQLIAWAKPASLVEAITKTEQPRVAKECRVSIKFTQECHW